MADVACPGAEDELELRQVDEEELEALVGRVVDLPQLGGLDSNVSAGCFVYTAESTYAENAYDRMKNQRQHAICFL